MKYRLGRTSEGIKMAGATTAKREIRPSSRQEEQHRLMEEAKQRPGVAEAIEVYERLASSPGMHVQPPTVRYSTGGNPTNER